MPYKNKVCILRCVCMCCKGAFVCGCLCRLAEELLMSKPPGHFLIRVSESRIGYTLSYRWVFLQNWRGFVSSTHSVLRVKVPLTLLSLSLWHCPLSADERCRHFMIDVLVAGQYMIVGENRRHQSLQDLVEFHRRTPIMPLDQVLTVACGQVREKTHTGRCKAYLFIL